MFSATDYEGMAWRLALKDYFDANLKYLKQGSIASHIDCHAVPLYGQSDAVYPYVSFGQNVGLLDDHNPNGTVIDGTGWPQPNPKYILQKDGTYSEQATILIIGNDHREVSSVLLSLASLMNPEVERHGLFLDLGTYYYSRICKFTTMGKGIQMSPDDGRGLVHGLYNILVDVDSVKVISINDNKLVYGFNLEVE